MNTILRKRSVFTTWITALLLLCALTLCAAFISCEPAFADENQNEPLQIQSDSNVSVYRLYNHVNSEHFYTTSVQEKDWLNAMSDWNYEGIGWYAPASGDNVYRLYNHISGEHLFTRSAVEKDSLLKGDWLYEGIAFYSAQENTGKKLYRLYNPGLPQIGQHHYTASEGERSALIEQYDWNDESVAFYVAELHDHVWQPQTTTTYHPAEYKNVYASAQICRNCIYDLIPDVCLGDIITDPNQINHLFSEGAVYDVTKEAWDSWDGTVKTICVDFNDKEQREAFEWPGDGWYDNTVYGYSSTYFYHNSKYEDNIKDHSMSNRHGWWGEYRFSKQVVSKNAWTETSVVGYQCTTCGAYR